MTYCVVQSSVNLAAGWPGAMRTTNPPAPSPTQHDRHDAEATPTTYDYGTTRFGGPGVGLWQPGR